MEIALALVAALLFALGTVLQQKAGLDDPADTDAPGGTSGLLLQMARRPVWLAGIAADALGFAAQAVALTIGRLAVVQPLLVSSVVFALPLGVRLTGQTVRRADVIAALVVAAALAAFLIVADPSGGRDDAPLREWMIACGACVGAAAALMVVARGGPAGRRAAVIGAAAGILFGLTAALTKSVGDQFSESVLSIFTHWHLYGLIAVGYVALTLSQLSLQTGVLAPRSRPAWPPTRSPPSCSARRSCRSRSTPPRSASRWPCSRSSRRPAGSPCSRARRARAPPRSRPAARRACARSSRHPSPRHDPRAPATPSAAQRRLREPARVVPHRRGHDGPGHPHPALADELPAARRRWAAHRPPAVRRPLHGRRHRRAAHVPRARPAPAGRAARRDRLRLLHRRARQVRHGGQQLLLPARRRRHLPRVHRDPPHHQEPRTEGRPVRRRARGERDLPRDRRRARAAARARP